MKNIKLKLMMNFDKTTFKIHSLKDFKAALRHLGIVPTYSSEYKA